jgi:ketosteroid isomerase-like protein
VGREENLESARAGYEEFARGDIDAVLARLSDDVEWIVPGQSAISGTYRGKQRLRELWATLAARSFRTQPEYWFTDDQRVCVLSHMSVDEGEMDGAELFTFGDDGRIVRYQVALDTALLERLFPSRS